MNVTLEVYKQQADRFDWNSMLIFNLYRGWEAINLHKMIVFGSLNAVNIWYWSSGLFAPNYISTIFVLSIMCLLSVNWIPNSSFTSIEAGKVHYHSVLPSPPVPLPPSPHPLSESVTTISTFLPFIPCLNFLLGLYTSGPVIELNFDSHILKFSFSHHEDSFIYKFAFSLRYTEKLLEMIFMYFGNLYGWELELLWICYSEHSWFFTYW